MVEYDIEVLSDSDQLNLFGTRRWMVVDDPWEGTAPRALTGEGKRVRVDPLPPGGLIR